MTKFITTDIKNFPARTILKIDGNSFSFSNEDVLSTSENIVELSDAAALEVAAKSESIIKSEAKKEKKAAKDAAKRRAALAQPKKEITLEEQLLTLSEFCKAGSTMTASQAKYLAALANKSGDTMENIGWTFNSVVSKNEASIIINQYLEG